MGLFDAFESWSHRRSFERGRNEGFNRAKDAERELAKIGTLEGMVARRNNWRQDPDRYSTELMVADVLIGLFPRAKQRVLDELDGAQTPEAKRTLLKRWKEDPDLYQLEIGIAERELSPPS